MVSGGAAGSSVVSILSASRTLRWRIEDAVARVHDGGWTPSGLYRSVATGDVDLTVNPKYAASNNEVLKISRDPNCHVTPETIRVAKEFRKTFSGEMVLTLVPHSQYCPQQARELAAALDVEVILPSIDGYSTIDGGGHLDKRSAAKFTEAVMSELVKTKAYKGAFSAGAVGTSPAN